MGEREREGVAMPMPMPMRGEKWIQQSFQRQVKYQIHPTVEFPYFFQKFELHSGLTFSLGQPRPRSTPLPHLNEVCKQFIRFEFNEILVGFKSQP